MKLIEILLDGVPSTKGVLQYRFEPGLNPWKQKGSFPIVTLLEVLQTLVYPMSREKDPLGPGKCRRAGITFEARDTVYRLTRDFTAKKLLLSQLEPGGQDRFRDLSHESRFIIETLNRSAKLPSKNVFRSLLICTPGKLGEEKPQKNETSLSGGIAPSGDARSRLEQLTKEKETLENSKQLEVEQDDLQQKLYKIEDDLQKLNEPREEVKRMMAEYEPYNVFDKTGLITTQVLNKFKGFKTLEEKKANDLNSIEERYVQYTAEITQIPQRLWWKEPLFIGSILFAVFSFVATSIYSKLWFIPFVLSCLGSGASYYLWLQREENLISLRKKIRALDPEKAGVEKRFDIEAQAVKKIKEVIGTGDLEEISENMRKWEELKVERKKIEERQKKLEAEFPEKKLKEEREKIQERLGEIQSSLHDMPAVTMDIHSLNREIQALEISLQGNSQIEVKVDEGAPKDPITVIIEAACELLEKPSLELILQTQKALDANIAAVTGRGYSGIEWQSGEIPSIRAGNGDRVNWFALSEEDRSLVKFAVQFTFWQLLLSQRPLPLWVDLISHPASEKITKVVLSGAKHIAGKGQVVILSN